MESIKREESLLLQELSCDFLVEFMNQVCDRDPSPNSKLLTNLCALLKSDTEFTPKIVSIQLKDYVVTHIHNTYNFPLPGKCSVDFTAFAT